MVPAEAWAQFVNEVGANTVRESVHVLPPIFNAKLAVPEAEGVPVMLTDKFPEPILNEPADIVAVRPVTPEEATEKALKEPPLPPV
jgi:hypothetical protein